MTVTLRAQRGWLIATSFAALALVATVNAAARDPQRILLIQSFGPEIEGYGTVAAAFRSEFVRGSSRPLAIYEASLDAARPDASENDRILAEFLRARFRAAAPDLVVTFGQPAARFYQTQRSQLFPSTPFVIASFEHRHLRNLALGPGDAAIAARLQLRSMIEHILRILPDTRTIAVVLGVSPLESFWASELRREFASFDSRVDFVWLNDSSFEQMRDRVANLPQHSAIFYALLAVDAAGVPHEREHTLRILSAAANAPIFGLYDIDLGNGVVGGPYLSLRRDGEIAAQTALRLLRAQRNAEPVIEVTELENPVYDWRQLNRWGIDPGRLPSNSSILFQPPTLWDQYKVEIVTISATLIAQSVLIAALIAQRRRRRRAEQEAQSLGGRLITAHEDERRRVGRELHDDVTQRLARLAIDAARMNKKVSSQTEEEATSLRDGLVQLSKDVHALSYRLHPSVLEDLGLGEALRAECDRLTRRESIRAEVDVPATPQKPSNDAALCLFRIAQEALSNIARHANATAVKLSLKSRDSGLELVITDDGAGFDPLRGGKRPSLGLSSMRERVRLLGGQLNINSAVGQGTTIVAWVPLRSST